MQKQSLNGKSIHLSGSILEIRNHLRWAEHAAWLRDSLSNGERYLFIILHENFECGFVHLKRLATGKFEVAIIIDPNFQRYGIAKSALLMLREHFPFVAFR